MRDRKRLPLIASLRCSLVLVDQFLTKWTMARLGQIDRADEAQDTQRQRARSDALGVAGYRETPASLTQYKISTPLG